MFIIKCNYLVRGNTFADINVEIAKLKGLQNQPGVILNLMEIGRKSIDL